MPAAFPVHCRRRTRSRDFPARDRSESSGSPHLSLSYQRHARRLKIVRAALPLPHLDTQHLAEDSDSERDIALVHIRKTEPQRVRQRVLHKEITSWGEEHAALAHVNQQLARGAS